MFGLVDDNLNNVKIDNGVTIPILSVMIACALAFYFLRGFGLFYMAKNSKTKKIKRISYFAFIPFLWVYLAGSLCGDIRLFGNKVKNFTLILTLFFVISGLLALISDIIIYSPLVKYVFDGGTVYYNSTGYLTSHYYFANSSLSLDYEIANNFSSGLINTLYVIGIIAESCRFLAEIGLIFVYAELFRRYWPRHSFAGIIFSIVGLFPIFVFVVRKNKPVNYNDYFREQYQNMYGNRNIYNQNSSAGADPFEEYSSASKTEKNKGEDPFPEFDDKKN